MIRFFITEAANVGDEIYLSADDSHHLTRVLRAKVGDEVQIIAAETVYLAEVTALGERAAAKLIEECDKVFESQTKVWLLQGVAKGERMELVIQKAVELGVYAIVPVDCARSVVKLKANKAEDRRARWQKIAESAAKQCGRTHIPEILPISGLKQALKLLPEDTKIFIPWEEAEKPTFKELLREGVPANAALIIGPEGGFERDEVLLAKEHGAFPLTLGQRILRTETAAIAALAVMMYEWGGLG